MAFTERVAFLLRTYQSFTATPTLKFVSFAIRSTCVIIEFAMLKSARNTRLAASATIQLAKEIFETPL